MKNAEKSKSEFLIYKGRPLVRCKDTIYYGNINDPFIVKFEIKEKNQNGEISYASKVIVQLLDTSPDLSSKKKIIKSSEKDGLYSAIDIANVWLERSLSV